MDLARAIGPSHGDSRPWLVGRLIEVDTATNRALVTIDGSPSLWLPFVPGVYDGVTTVYVLRDPAHSGAGQLIIGPCYAEPAQDVPVTPASPEEEATVAPIVTATALIRPTWSGTYRHIRSAWDRWNTDRYGGRSTLYQGDAYGSGPLTGLAVYGDQVKNLDALEITKIEAATPLATGSGTVTLQGAPHGSKPAGAPAPAGATSSGSSSVLLDATTREGLRTGTVKSLATVGASYRGTFGTSRADGMALSITYQRKR